MFPVGLFDFYYFFYFIIFVVVLLVHGTMVVDFFFFAEVTCFPNLLIRYDLLSYELLLNTEKIHI